MKAVLSMLPGAFMTLAALHLHVVVHSGGIGVVGKETPTFTDTVVDARNADLTDYLTYPTPVKAYLVEAKIGIARNVVGLK